MKNKRAVSGGESSFILPVTFKPWPPNTLGGGFRLDWLTGSNKKLSAGFDCGAGLGNPMLTFWVERNGKRQYFDADMREVLRAAIVKVEEALK